jgi:hypothetical protein
MKKFVVFSLVGILILAFGTAFAQEKAPVLELKASGLIDTIGVLKRNQDAAAMPWGIYGPVSSTYRPGPGNANGGGAYDKTASYLATRARLRFDLIMGKDVTGSIGFEMDSARWGELTPVNNSQRNAMGVTNESADRAAVEIQMAYLKFGIPVIPIQMDMSAGLQGLVIRPDWLLANDGMGIVVAAKPVDPMMIKFLYGKVYEGNDAAADDVDEYGLELSYNVSTFTIGGYGLYQNMNTYPLPSVAGGTAVVTGLSALPAYGVADTNQADFFWFGAYLDGKLGPVNAKFDFAYDTGKVKSRADLPVRPSDVKYNGWAARAVLNFPWEKFNFGANLMYASGSDQKKTDGQGLPGNKFAPAGNLWGGTNTKVGSYIVPMSSEQFGAFTGDGSLVFYGSWVIRGNEFFNTPASAATGRVGRGAIGGTWYVKGVAGFKATPAWKLQFEGLYIGDTTKNGNTVGNARTAAGVPRDDKGIGLELDLISSLAIYKNLTWDIGFGYLFAGKALDYWDAGAVDNDSPKDPWTLCSRLAYVF